MHRGEATDRSPSPIQGGAPSGARYHETSDGVISRARSSDSPPQHGDKTLPLSLTAGLKKKIALKMCIMSLNLSSEPEAVLVSLVSGEGLLLFSSSRQAI